MADQNPNRIVSGMRQILTGIFGSASPQNELSAPGAVFGETPAEGGGPYTHREGPVFTPGAMNYVLQPFQETPLVTMWGYAFLRNPTAWRITQPPVAWVDRTVPVNGIGGPVAGTVVLSPLLEQDQSPETGA